MGIESESREINSPATRKRFLQIRTIFSAITNRIFLRDYIQYGAKLRKKYMKIRLDSLSVQIL